MQYFANMYNVDQESFSQNIYQRRHDELDLNLAVETYTQGWKKQGCWDMDILIDYSFTLFVPSCLVLLSVFFSVSSI